MNDTEALNRLPEDHGITPSEHPAADGPGRRKKALTVAAVLIAGWIFIMGMVVSYSEALANPTVNDVPIAVAGNADAIVGLLQNDSLDVTVVADAAAAQEQVLDRDAEAALVIPGAEGGEVTTYVATGASRMLALAAGALGDQVAEQLGTTNSVVDLAPPSENNPNGTLEFYLVIFLTLGASFGATIIGRVLGPIRTAAQFLTRAGILIVLSTALAAGAAFYATQLFDGITGEHGWAYFGALTFYCLVVSGAVTGIASLGGTIVGGVVSALFVLLGNSASGGPFGLHMLGDFFQVVRYIVPQTWGLELLRDIEYFDANGIGGPLLALSIWAAIGVVAALLGMLRHTLRNRPGAAHAAKHVSAVAVGADAPEHSDRRAPAHEAITAVGTGEHRELEKAPAAV
ncbi:ABC transporter permease [Occultella aeris]|uniref:ABC-2 family transporter protein n=1 Tax=Occultella aeris TaxID=2761496 RepID=A0A7M4DGH7_9MICO|nr:ABC transporter permease [Occultella aeris]VZO36020.1 ABC-2 family transporter protein [Occultella aeris]